MHYSKLFMSRILFMLLLFVSASRFFSAEVFAAGYKIPEQSLKSVGLGAAYVANASGPDSAYFNPANMVWSDEGAQIETNLIYIYLPSAKFEGSVFGNPVSADSKSESFVLPNIHYISPKRGKARFGLSVVYPFGLSKRWNDPFQQLFAEEFTLETIEIDLSVAFELSEQFAMGWGVRGIRSEGKVIRRGNFPVGNVNVPLSGEMEGDDFSAGYFLALSARPVQDLSMAVTYRSKVTPTLKGDAKISTEGSPDYNGPVELGIVLPAALQIATAYTYNRAVFEFVYERTYWSAYSALDFQFQPGLAPGLQTAFFDDVIEKNYSDSDTYRFGLTYHYKPKLTLLFGFAIDETPAPGETLNFELPDSDALIYSTGFLYRYSERTVFGLAYLTSQKKERAFTNPSANISGAVESSAHIASASFTYTF